MINYLQRYFRPMLIIIFVAISLSFVFFTSVPYFDRQPGHQKLGQINGHNITVQEFQQAQLATSVLFTLGSGQILPDNEYWRQRIAQQSWQRLLFLAAVERMGIVVDSRQCVEFIQRQPILCAKGQYLPAQYEQFQRVFLQPRGISSAQFGRIVADEIKIQKFITAIQSPIMVSEAEVSEEMTRKFGATTLLLVRFNPQDYLSKVVLAPNEAETFYEKNKFAAPSLQTKEKRKVNFVAFRLSAAEEKLAGKSREEARQKLAEKALAFSQRLDSRENLSRADFASLAQTEKLPVSATGWFAVDEPAQGVGASPNFNQTAFLLTAERPVSHVVEAGKAFYVLCLEEIQPAQPKAFAEVKGLIEQQLRIRKAGQMAAEAGQAAAQQLALAVGAGASFQQAATKLNLKVHTIPNLIPADPAQPKDGPDNIVRGLAASLPLRQPSPFYNTGTEGVIACVESRAPVDQSKFGKYLEIIEQDVANRAKMTLLNQWLMWQSRSKGTVNPDFFQKEDMPAS
jgi:hypothetical protein